MGLRNLYRVFRDSRKMARKHAALAVVGSPPGAERLAGLLEAHSSARDAQILVTITGARNGGIEVSLSGGAVEDAGETVLLSAVTGEAVLQELVPRIVGSVHEDYLIPLGRDHPVFRRAVCEEVIHKNARQNAVVGALPIPGADMPAITANQGRMVLSIAAVYGEEISVDRARELLGVLAAGFGLRTLARQVLKIIPVGGWAASGAMGYAGTLAMGRAAVRYFERGSREPGPVEMSEIMRRARQEAGSFLDRTRRR